MDKNKDVFSEIVVGVFMVAVLALLAYFTIVISGVDLLLGRESVDVRVAFDDVGGLKERDTVMYRGTKVGTVEKIELAESNIVVHALVDRSITLRATSRITVAPLSFLGGNYLSLEEGKGEAMPLETTVFRGQPPSDWMRDLGEVARNLNHLTSGGEIRVVLTNLVATTEKVKLVAERIERGEGTLGKLASTNETLWSDASAAVASARAIATRLENGEGTLGKLLSSDDAVYADLKRVIANAAEVSDRVARGEGTLGKLTSTNDVVYADLRAAIASVRAATDRLERGEGLLGRVSKDRELADSAAALVRNLEVVSDRLARGEGTLGRLSADRQLHDEISGLVKDVRQVVDNYRDTTPISSFGSLIMGGL